MAAIVEGALRLIGRREAEQHVEHLGPRLEERGLVDARNVAVVDTFHHRDSHRFDDLVALRHEVGDADLLPRHDRLRGTHGRKVLHFFDLCLDDLFFTHAATRSHSLMVKVCIDLQAGHV